MIFFTVSLDDADRLDSFMLSLSRGDKDALESIYELTHGAVYALSLSMLKNSHDAQDVLHDVFINLYTSAENYSSMGKPMAYIMAIARNLCLMKIRDRKKTADEPIEDWENYIEQKSTITQEDAVIIRMCMKELSDEEREIVLLHASAGFKHREIAEELELPLATVLSKYHRALKKLRTILQGG